MALINASGSDGLPPLLYPTAAERTSTPLTQADVGRMALQQDDGSIWMLTSAPLTWKRVDASNAPYALPMYFAGKPADGGLLYRTIMPRDITLPGALGGTLASAAVAATAAKVISLKKNGVEFAQATFAAGSAAGIMKNPLTPVVTADTPVAPGFAWNAAPVTGSYNVPLGHTVLAVVMGPKANNTYPTLSNPTYSGGTLTWQRVAQCYDNGLYGWAQCSMFLGTASGALTGVTTKADWGAGNGGDGYICVVSLGNAKVDSIGAWAGTPDRSAQSMSLTINALYAGSIIVGGLITSTNDWPQRTFTNATQLDYLNRSGAANDGQFTTFRSTNPTDAPGPVVLSYSNGGTARWIAVEVLLSATASPILLASGSVITAHGPTPQDATLSDVSITMVGTG